MLPHAPGVQMANIPEDGVPLKDESEAIDEANPDKRLPQQIKDKIVEADNEFEDSTKSGNKNETDSSAAPGINPNFVIRIYTSAYNHVQKVNS